MSGEGHTHMLVCRAIRGATTVESNTAEDIQEGTEELLRTILALNELTPDELQQVVARIEEAGLRTHLSIGEDTTIIGVVGVPIPPELQSDLESVPGVDEVLRVTKRYKLPSREFHPEPTRFQVRDVTIGG